MNSSLPAIVSEDQALDYLDALDVSAMKLGLSRMEAVLATLHNPQDELPTVHVAGTNGKGSVTAMMASVLRAAGYTVGTFTSPHLVSVRERLAINLEPISSEDFVAEVASLRAHLDTLNLSEEDFPTYFEFINLMAYRYFRRRNVDVAVVETGLGGRLDATNVVKKPLVSIITGISLDHQERLGDRLSDIAQEKAGIIKPGAPLVLGPNLPMEAMTPILKTAMTCETFVFQSPKGAFQQLDVDLDGGIQTLRASAGEKTIRLGLLGPYQGDNLATVLTALERLREQGWTIPDEAVARGLESVRWPARFQYLPVENLLVDGAHNPQGFAALKDGILACFPDRPIIWLVSLRANRLPDPLLAAIDGCGAPLALVFCSGPKTYLYHAPKRLGSMASRYFQCPMHFSETIADALATVQALQQETPQALGVVCGSLYTAGEVLRMTKKFPLTV